MLYLRRFALKKKVDPKKVHLMFQDEDVFSLKYCLSLGRDKSFIRILLIAGADPTSLDIKYFERLKPILLEEKMQTYLYCFILR